MTSSRSRDIARRAARARACSSASRGALPPSRRGDHRRQPRGAARRAVRRRARRASATATTTSRARRSAGAAAAIVEDASRTTLPALVVRDTRRAAAVAAAACLRRARRASCGWSASPARTARRPRSACCATCSTSRGARAASIGTLGVLVGSEGEPLAGGSGLTTPGPGRAAARAARARSTRGVRTRRDGVSSHASTSGAWRGCAFDAGGVHEPHARPSRLSRHDGGVLRGEGAARRATSRRTASRSSTPTTRRGDALPPSPRTVRFGSRRGGRRARARRALHAARQRVDARARRRERTTSRCR